MSKSVRSRFEGICSHFNLPNPDRPQKYAEWQSDSVPGPDSVWPDLAKFRPSVNILKVFGKCLRVYLIFGKMMTILRKFFYAIGHIFLVTNGQIWKNQYSHMVTLTMVLTLKGANTDTALTILILILAFPNGFVFQCT